MRQGDLLEPTCQALARARAQSQRGGTGCDDMYPNLSSPQPVPLALEARGPVVQQVRFIEQNDCAPRQRNPLRPAPQALPKARYGRFGAVPGDIDRGIRALFFE